MSDDDPENLIEEFLADEETQRSRRPAVVALMLFTLAHNEDARGDVPLEAVVTPESIDSWDLDELAEAMEDFSLYSKVEYLSPEWAKVLLVRTGGLGGRLTSDTLTSSPGVFYMRFREEIADWRVHAFAGHLDVDELPVEGGIVKA